MKRRLFAMVVVLLLTVSVTRAQTLRNAAAIARPDTVEARAGGPDKASPLSGAMVLSLFDKGIVKRFNEAWQRAAAGTVEVEAVILIVGNADGSCKAILPPPTNETRQFSFRWQPGTIAIAHTHPNSSDPIPQAADLQLADRYGVPMFTLTRRGMYMYDPATRKTTKVQNGLDWLELSKWKPPSTLARQK